jgi:hypothetical protein
MSALETAVKAKLEADTGAGGVKTLLTGGLYTFVGTGRNGISRQTTSAAFDATTGILKPCCVVKERALNPDGGARDTGVASYRTVVELWFYDDSDAASTTIASAAARAFDVLDGVMIGDTKWIPRWMGNPVQNERDRALDNALVLRSDYDVRGLY